MIGQLKISQRDFVFIAIIALLCAIIIGMAVSACLRSSDGWAALSAWSSMIGAVLSFLGIIITAWIAWKSYESSLISAEISRRALNANRAWMMPSTMSAIWQSEIPIFPDLVRGVYFKCTFQNFGGAPALDVDIEYWLQPVSLPTGVRAPFEIRHHEQSPAVPHGGELDLSLSMVNGDADLFADGTTDWHVRIEAKYRDVLVDSTCGFSATYALSFESEGSNEFGEDQYTVTVYPFGKPTVW